MLDFLRTMMYYIEVGKRVVHMEQYRSGHNGHDWKSCVRQKRTEGSNPSCSARKETPFVHWAEGVPLTLGMHIPWLMML